MKKFLFCSLLVFAICACDSGGSNSPPSLDGPYEIQTQIDGSDVTYDLDLKESDDNLSGSGLLIVEDPNSPRAVTVDLNISGSHNHPDVNIQMDVQNGGTISFDGTSGEDGERVGGTLTLANGDQQDVVLRSE